MRGTRWREVLRQSVSAIHRELRITMTPLAEPEAWLFLVGCYNSGTELLAKILGSHPDISALPHEGQFLTDQLQRDYELGVPRMWVLREDLFRLTEKDDGPDVERLKREWIMRLDRSASVFLEKSPPNMARTRWLQREFPNAHFLALVRNGYAVAEGIRRKAEPHHRREGWPIEWCARQWARSNEVLLEDAKFLERVLWMSYEDLVEEPAGSVDRIARFIGVDPQATNDMGLSTEWRVHEKESPITNMNPESIGRLSSREKAIITRTAGSVLSRFDYELL